MPVEEHDDPDVAMGSAGVSSRSLRHQANQALQLGDIAKAVDLYEKAVSMSPADLQLRIEFGFLLWRTYDFQRGSEILRELVEDARTGISTLKSISKHFFEAGFYRRAAMTMQVAAERDSTDLEAIELYAGALERDNQIELAREQANRARELDPASVRATRLLAHLDKRAGAFASAVARLQAHLESYQSELDWRLRYELAASLDRLEHYDEAWRQLSLAKEQLASATQPHLRKSYRIRRRQWELLKLVTEVDLRRWRCEATSLAEKRIALLAGFPRSGTTLLEQMLASHESCVATDETGILASQFTAPMIWQSETASDAIIELRSLEEDQLVAGRESYFRMTQAFLEGPIGERLLVEKDPMMTPDLALPLRLLPEAKILMPLRDPRDVMISYYFTMVPLNWNSAPATSIAEACRFYHDCMRHWLVFRQQESFSWHELRYEDLVTRPEDTLRTTATFLDLPWDAAMLDRSRRSERKAVRTPTYDDITKPVTARSVGRWKHYARYLEPATKPLTPFLRALGYD